MKKEFIYLFIFKTIQVWYHKLNLPVLRMKSLSLVIPVAQVTTASIHELAATAVLIPDPLAPPSTSQARRA